MKRFSEYRIMWVMVTFDLPTSEFIERKAAMQFRKQLQKEGFTIFQYSIYVRPCASRENATVHINRVKSFLPTHGDVCIFCLTDKQFGDIEIYHSMQKKENNSTWKQLELF